ncbi:MAG: isoprenylcysteine carboxylmethyltransferase family protein [Anaerolineae bacterium]|nr:isoprenylcysteine carboxylmethyltransferase family protein [Anaerolineae bacterium]
MTGKNAQSTAAFPWRSMIGLAIYMLLNPVILFVSAGTVNWMMAWVYSGVAIVLTLVSRMMMFRWNPELAQERANYRDAEGVKSWDRYLGALVGIYGNMAILIVAGLDKRFGWSPAMVRWIPWIALTIFLSGFALGTWALVENKFFSAVVRIQTDRGHKVCRSGPYGFVRHPGYLGAIIFSAATPLILGAIWALIPMGITVMVTILRTALEDRTLQAELEGYQSYSEQTRYRLIPGLW